MLLFFSDQLIKKKKVNKCLFDKNKKKKKNTIGDIISCYG